MLTVQHFDFTAHILDYLQAVQLGHLEIKDHRADWLQVVASRLCNYLAQNFTGLYQNFQAIRAESTVFIQLQLSHLVLDDLQVD